MRTVAFTHRLASPDELWDGLLGATVRTSPLILGQPEPMQRRIRAAFDRLVEEYRGEGGLELPGLRQGRRRSQPDRSGGSAG